MQLDITGFSELTPYKGGWCGNDAFTRGYAKERRTVRTMARKLGNRLYKEGYRGVFCIDFLIHTDTHDVYLGEINPRISGASPLTNLITSPTAAAHLPVPYARVYGHRLGARYEQGAGSLERVRQLEPARP